MSVVSSSQNSLNTSVIIIGSCTIRSLSLVPLVKTQLHMQGNKLFIELLMCVKHFNLVQIQPTSGMIWPFGYLYIPWTGTGLIHSELDYVSQYIICNTMPLTNVDLFHLHMHARRPLDKYVLLPRARMRSRRKAMPSCLCVCVSAKKIK